MLGPRLYLAEVYGRMTSLTGVMPLDWSRETLKQLHRTRPRTTSRTYLHSYNGAHPIQHLKEAAGGEAFMQIEWCWGDEKGLGKR